MAFQKIFNPKSSSSSFHVIQTEKTSLGDKKNEHHDDTHYSEEEKNCCDINLNDTLDQKIFRYKLQLHQQREKQLRYFSQKNHKKFEKERTAKMYERLQNIALRIAKEMESLHSNDIIMGDLNPQNISFDEHGNVCLVLDCEEKQNNNISSERNKNNKESTTEAWWCWLYESPESFLMKAAAGKKCAFNTTSKYCNVYSFGVLLLELCTLRRPFLNCRSKQDLQQYVIHGYRPSTKSVNKDTRLRSLIENCWHVDATKRPTFTAICVALQDILDQWYGINNGTNKNKSNKSNQTKLHLIKAQNSMKNLIPAFNVSHPTRVVTDLA